MRFSIVVPCYNEEENIPLILDRFSQSIKDRTDIEVILVNNGSTDNSETVISELLPGYPFARCVKVEVNQGYGFGILSGLKQAEGEFIGWTHADMQTDPADVIKAADIIAQNNFDKTLFVKGNRKGRSIFDVFFTVGMSFYESLYLGQRLWDINAQPNLFSRSFFESWEDPPYDFSLDLYALYLARKNRCWLIRFPVRFPKRIHGSSKWNTGLGAKRKFIKRTLDFSKALKKRGVR